MIAAGYASTHEALDEMGDELLTGRGVYPRRTVEVAVDREACVGCGLCGMLAPHVMRMDSAGKAIVLKSSLEGSRADGDFVHQCPTDAIHVTVLDGDERRPSVQMEAISDVEDL
jgi:ferredoxin